MTADDQDLWDAIEAEAHADQVALGRAVLDATVLELARRRAREALAALDVAEGALASAVDEVIDARAEWIAAADFVQLVAAAVARRADPAAVGRGLEAA